MLVYYKILILICICLFILLTQSTDVTVVYPYQCADTLYYTDNIPIPVDTVVTLTIEQLIAEIAELYGLDSLLAFSIVKEESNFDPAAVNIQSGCSGLWQLNPKYFKLDDIYDPEQNTNWGVWYFMELLDKFENDTLKALTGYAYGPYHRQTLKFGNSPYAKRILKRYYTLCSVRGQRTTLPKRFVTMELVLQI